MKKPVRAELLPLSERISLAQKMLRELDPGIVEDAILEMRFLPDGAAAVTATLEKHLSSKELKGPLERYRRALRNTLDRRRDLVEADGFEVVLTDQDELGDILKEELTGIEKRLANRRPVATRFDYLARVAVKTARNLLLRAGRQPMATRGSVWPKLAAILLGEPNRDLYPIVCELASEKKAGAT